MIVIVEHAEHRPDQVRVKEINALSELVLVPVRVGITVAVVVDRC